MNKELKPYDEYKETDLSWLDKVPKHWEIKPNRVLWNERETINCISEQLLSVTIKKGIISQAELLQSSSKKDSSNVDKSKYKLVAPNDIVYNKMRMWQGAVGVSNDRGIVSPAYIVLKPRGDINHRYYHFLLRTPGYIEESHRNSYGICDDQLSLRYEDFKGMQNIIPPKDEQDQIVRYLDSKLSKANKFINTKTKQIDLLKELKQAIINKAVTKGLNPTAKMKPSGIEWLGGIPEGWEVRRLKNLAKVNPSLNNHLDKYDLNEEVVFLPMERISENGEIDQRAFKPIAEAKKGFTGFVKNDVVVAKITPCFENGKGACLDGLKSHIGYGTTELIVLRPNDNILSKFLYLIARTSFFRNLGTKMMTGSAGQKRVPAEFVSNFALGIPNIKEQLQIVSYIKTKTLSIDNAIEAIKKEINLISEYRTSLISDVVTGKVDVRHIEVEETFEEVEQDFNDLEEDIEEYAGEEPVEKEGEVCVN